MTESITYLLADAIVELIKADMAPCAFWVRTFALAVVGRVVISDPITQAQIQYDMRNHARRPRPPPQADLAFGYARATAALNRALRQLEQSSSTWRDPVLSQRREDLTELRNTIETARAYGADAAISWKLNWPL